MSKNKRKYYFCMVASFAVILIIIGCSTKISKTALTNHMLDMNYYQMHNENTKSCERWDNCFDITEEEFRVSFNKIHYECIKQEKRNLPQMVGYVARKSYAQSIDTCARNKFLKEHRENFTFDKTPECIEQCQEIRSYLKKLRKN